MQAIDVVMLTKNSEHLLKKCLASIYKNVPVKDLIVVDGFSTDRTLNILQTFGKNHSVKILKVNGSRAAAREVGIREASTDWFMFADSDVLLSEEWYKNAVQSIQPDIGAVWGVNLDVLPNVHDGRLLQVQQRIAQQCFALRGGTHDTLIRRDLVVDIKIPRQLHTYEDAFIMNWIKEKGYRAVVGEDIYCLHFKPPENWNLNNAIVGAVQEMRCGLLYSRNFVYMAYYPIFMFYWGIQIAFQNLKPLVPTMGDPAPSTDGQRLDAAKLDSHQSPR